MCLWPENDLPGPLQNDMPELRLFPILCGLDEQPIKVEERSRPTLYYESTTTVPGIYCLGPQSNGRSDGAV